MSITKHKLTFDTTDLDGSDNIGAYLRSSDGTLLTHTTNGGKESLDVNISNTSVEVTATDLDIRDLSHSSDSVKIGDGTDFLEVNNDGSINVAFAAGSEIKITDGTDDLEINADGSINSIVSATDLDIRDLTFATDSVDVSGSEVSLDATTLAALENITVSATDLDIRDLTHVSDSVKIGDGTDFLAINADGSINVNADISVVNGGEKAEDTAHSSGDIGNYVLSVRQDSLSASAADGDYQSFKTDALGRLYMNETHQTMAHSAVSVGNTATDLVGTDLSNRKTVLLQNISNTDMYFGSSASVTTANGILLPKGASVELKAGAAINLHGITAAGTASIRVLELA